ncbi:MAG: tRNA pseudouridine(55) synthase TruB [Mariprofundus sp.]|nr:tRNA pseudouridine(55) synthase TruB [Mariprofundus sp.]
MLLNDVCGIIFLDKPHGWSSRRAVNEVARIFSISGQKRMKAGHAGTLDPLATGMLPILLGDATRFAEMGLNAEKSYRVSFDLSYQSDTLDMEGEVCARFDVSVTQQQVESALAEFRGEIEQVPPLYSAIRIHGKRAHALARKGEHVEMQARRVSVLEMELMSFESPIVTLEISCSKGTYIRSLARDIGANLGLGGCVRSLRRLATGGWPEAMMVTPEVLAQQKEACLLPLAQWLREYEHQALHGDEIKRFLQGQRIQLKHTEADIPETDVAVFSDDILLGTGVLKGGMRHMVLHPVRIMPSAQKLFL